MDPENLRLTTAPTAGVRPALSLIVNKDRVGIPQRSKELKEIRFGVKLCLFEDAILDRSFEDFLLRALADERLQVYIRLGKDAGLAIVDIGLLIIERGNKYFGRGKPHCQYPIFKAHMFGL